jgi:arylsulfatase A-like enzyme
MRKADNPVKATILSFWKIFRLTFVIFFLYLLRDAFYRWDGFAFHSTFSEFIPSFALVTIFWTSIASILALAVWFLLKGWEVFCNYMGWKSRIAVLLLFAEVFLLLAICTLIAKTVVSNELLSQTFKVIILLSIFFASLLITWQYRNELDIVNERITPLVWLFGIWFMSSIPIVSYHVWLKRTDLPTAQRIAVPFLADTKQQNILLVSFDAMTSRDMSVYGYERETTPFLKKWAETAAVFNRFESASNWTASAAASMMTGKRVWTHRMFQGDSKLVKSATESLPLELKKHGYYNMAFVANGYASVKSLGIDNGFDIALRNTEFGKSRTLIGIRFGTLDIMLSGLFGDKIKSYSWIISPDFILGEFLRKHFLYSDKMTQTEAPPETAFNYFLTTIDKGVPSPFFAWIHIYPPHDPYLASEKFIGMFDPSPKLRSFNKQMEDEVSAHKVNNDENWAIYRARYDEFIRYCDEQFKDFVQEIRKRDALKDTVIIITSDHGESFEHGYFTHNTVHHYEQVTHIPLIIKEPGQAAGRIINELADQVDLAPTILDMANIPVAPWMEGRSLLPLVRGEVLQDNHAYSMSFQKNPSIGTNISKGTIAIWEGNYKLIHYLEDNNSLLFNLEQDPDERKNLFDEKSEIGQHLLALIHDNLNKANKNWNALEIKDN